ncbi:MAG: DsrE family protein [Rhodospirillaceae bacterium]|nr:DsrE family protein [Rhodospirillaceae bacterium]
MLFTRRFAIGAIAVSVLAAPVVMAAQATPKTHKLALHIDSEDVQTMNMVLGNAMNAKKYYDDIGEPLEVEVVAYGPGITMLRDDKSPVKDRIAEAKKAVPNLALSMCNNAKTAAEKREGHPITPLPGVKVVPAGIVRLIELQEQGWTYIRP